MIKMMVYNSYYARVFCELLNIYKIGLIYNRHSLYNPWFYFFSAHPTVRASIPFVSIRKIRKEKS